MYSIFIGILSMVLMLSLNYLYISGSFFFDLYIWNCLFFGVLCLSRLL